jgi:BCD family chlorophyll transporter-like MFS transporter
LAFGAWGMGYNLASVSYLSLASELSGENERGKTIAVMWFMMIVSVILTAITLGNMLEVYNPATLQNSFWMVGIVALILGLAGLFKLESATVKQADSKSDTYTVKQMADAIFANKQALNFFIYLWLLLAALLGQDVLLEPFAAQAFGLTVKQTTHITSAWGTFVLIAILIAGALEKRVARKTIAQVGNIGALIGFLVIIASGLIANKSIFYTGVSLLGAGTGLSTVANLALMFDLTVREKIGLYIGAWGFSNAMSRLTGILISGILRDVVNQITGNALSGYIFVFATLSVFLAVAISLLVRINILEFQTQALSPVERAALAD